jgi:DNA-binding CsgD family transcriptional regulator/PAS domain-containing protein
MDTNDRLLGLIQELYAAPGMVDGWREFLGSLRTAVHGSGANLICHDPRSGVGRVLAYARSDADGIRLYQQHWSAYDPWATSPKLTQIREGSVGLGEALIAHTVFKHTAFYCDFGRFYDVGRCVVGLIDTKQQPISVVSINRSERQTAFANEDVALLSALMPHLQRALQLHRRLLSSEALAHDLGTAIDLGVHAVILVDAAGRIVFLNRAASRLLAFRDGLLSDAGELRASHGAETGQLRSLIADAAKTSAGGGIGAGGAIALSRPSGLRPLTAIVSPVAGRRVPVPGADAAAALVVVTGWQCNVGVDETDLRMPFGLTPAEAKLARLLAEGVSLTNAAAQLALSRETVRSRVKSIFQKTNTHGQAELVRLLLTARPGV